MIIPTLEEIPSVGHLKVFSAILKSSERCMLFPLLENIGKFLQQPYICQSKKGTYQKQIISCCSSLISVCKEVRLFVCLERFLSFKFFMLFIIYLKIFRTVRLYQRNYL